MCEVCTSRRATPRRSGHHRKKHAPEFRGPEMARRRDRTDEISVSDRSPLFFSFGRVFFFLRRLLPTHFSELSIIDVGARGVCERVSVVVDLAVYQPTESDLGWRRASC